MNISSFKWYIPNICLILQIKTTNTCKLFLINFTPKKISADIDTAICLSLSRPNTFGASGFFSTFQYRWIAVFIKSYPTFFGVCIWLRKRAIMRIQTALMLGARVFRVWSQWTAAMSELSTGVTTTSLSGLAASLNPRGAALRLYTFPTNPRAARLCTRVWLDNTA